MKTVFSTYPTGSDYQIVKVFENHDRRIRGGFLCNNSKCVNYEDLCDHFSDCEDYSDERVCSKKYSCSKNQFVTQSKQCDGLYDCFNKMDECDGCSVQGLLSGWEQFMASFIRCSAVIINLVSIYNALRKFKLADSVSSLVNDVLVGLITVGDLLVGVYMIFCSYITTSRIMGGAKPSSSG